MPDFGQATVNGVQLMLLVAGLVEFSKKFGVKGHWLIAEGVVFGFLFSFLYQILDLVPYLSFWFPKVIYSVAFALAASGIYDVVDKRLPKR